MQERAGWFYGTILVKITVEGDPRTVVHENTVLVAARDAEEAYARALELGQRESSEYLNPMGKRVTFEFVGLQQLDRIHDDVLEHGTELFYSEEVGLSDEQIAKRVSRKEELNLFRSTPDRDDRPDYTSIEIMGEVKKLLRGSGDEPPS